jgi:predicted AAA+ superfamily ATPase
MARNFPVVVVTGARQVGKSTLLSRTFGEKARHVVFDPVQDVEGARRDPDLFLASNTTPLILDEIQYVPDLVPALKRRVDRDRTPGQYFLTGSQQWGVLKAVAESLAGRAVFLDLEGFCLAELGGSLHPTAWLESYLDDPDGFVRRPHARLKLPHSAQEHVWRGFLPEAQFLPRASVPDFHAAYQRTYVERDVRLMADISDWALFGRFVRLTAALTAQEINFAEIGRELGLAPQTSRRWLDLLVATFQWFELPAYHGNAIKRLSARPKGHLSDTGVAAFAQAISSPQALGGHPLWGALFESAAVAELRKQASVLAPRPNAYHWRTHAGAEVDLILERDGVFFPIEVKGRSHPDRHDAAGIRAFQDTYPRLQIAPGLILAPAASAYQASNNVYVIPWDIAATQHRRKASRVKAERRSS